MKSIALSLLIFMALIFVITKVAAEHFKWIHFVRAFAEAAMVGAIADWFAVTALFRHPMGLPLPHTAIIPNKKDRIGESLGDFVQNNFLTEEALRTKLKAFEIERKVQEWLAVPENSAMVAEAISKNIPGVLNLLDDKEVRVFIEKNITLNLKGDEIAKLGSTLLETLTRNDKHNEIFNEMLKIVERIVYENKQIIWDNIKQESPWFVPEFVNKRVYQRLIIRTGETFEAIHKDREHPLRKKFTEAIQHFITQLRTSPEFHDKVEELKMEIITNPQVQQYVEQVLNDLKMRVIDDLSKPDSAIRKALQDNIFNFFNAIARNERLRKRIVSIIYDGLIRVVSNYRGDLGNLISSTIKSWDKKTVSDKLELSVGRDLQYIRISGTLVGGCVGLLIHIVTLLLEGIGLLPG